MTSIAEKPDRIISVDILRIVLAFFIALLHLNWEFCPQGYLSVEIFFVLSGYFFALNYGAKRDIPIINALVRKIKPYYVYYIFAVIAFAVISGKTPSLSQSLNVLLMWNLIGMAPQYGLGGWWFLGVYTYVTVFYYLLFRLLPQKKALLLTVIGCFLLLNALYFLSPVNNINISKEVRVFNIIFGFCRGVLAVGVGILFGSVHERFKSLLPVWCRLAGLIILSIGVIYIFLHSVTAAYDFLIYPLSGLLVYFAVSLPCKYINKYPPPPRIFP
jgi:peptidoglycan/LPS O-acetylase OafA/YrhL